MYVTPGFFRKMATGYDVSSMSDADLAHALNTAGLEVNRYCAAPTYPKPHDFRGGTITDEQHAWDVGNIWRAPTLRIYPYHQPITVVSTFSIEVTNNSSVTIDPTDTFLNTAEQYVEVLSLAPSVSVFVTGMYPVMDRRPPIARIGYTYGRTFSVTDERFYADSPYSTYRGLNQWWTSATVTVKKNDVVVDPSDYTLDLNEGTVTFDSLQSSSDVILVSYTHKLPGDIARATAYAAIEVITASDFAGTQGVSGIHVEEIELRFSRAATVWDGITKESRAGKLLNPYIFRSWG